MLSPLPLFGTCFSFSHMHAHTTLTCSDNTHHTQILSHHMTHPLLTLTHITHIHTTHTCQAPHATCTYTHTHTLFSHHPSDKHFLMLVQESHPGKSSLKRRWSKYVHLSEFQLHLLRTGIVFPVFTYKVVRRVTLDFVLDNALYLDMQARSVSEDDDGDDGS